MEDGQIFRFAGTGEPGYDGDGGLPCSAKLNGPAGLAVDREDNIHVADLINCAVRKIDRKTGIIMTLAGSGQRGYDGDGGPADKAAIDNVYGLAIDKQDNLYLIDSLNFAVRKVDARIQIISTIVGKGKPGPVVEFSSLSDSLLGGKPHLKRTVGSEVAHAIEVESQGNLFIGETGTHRIRMAHKGMQRFLTVAGSGKPRWTGDNGPALQWLRTAAGRHTESLRSP